MEFIEEYLMGWNVAALACLIAGTVLLVAEMFTPGMGVAGVLGIIAVVASLFLYRGTFANAMITVAILVIVLGIAAFFVFRSFKKGRISRSELVLNETISEKSTSLSDDATKALKGMRGTALTQLRPSGNAMIGEKRIDVVTNGDFIKKGERIEVVSVEGLKVLVRRVTDEQDEGK